MHVSSKKTKLYLTTQSTIEMSFDDSRDVWMLNVFIIVYCACAAHAHERAQISLFLMFHYFFNSYSLIIFPLQ